MKTNSSKRRKYHLQVCPGDSIQGPSAEEIETAIRSLPGGVPSFVILSKKKYEFMQTSGSVSEGFEIQYEEFSRDGLWEHGSRELPAEVVVRLVQLYASDDDRWRTELPWKRVSRAESDRRAAQALQENEATLPREGVIRGLAKGSYKSRWKNLDFEESETEEKSLNSSRE
jgi:hypothetical protein